MSPKESTDKFSKRREMKSVKEDLFKWICQKHAMNSFLDRYLLRQKTLELTKMRGVNGFKCSDYWMNSFLRDHGFSTDLSNRTGPMFDNYRDWIDLMRPTIIKYKHSELFHVDELTMYSDIFPTRITADEIDNEEGNRITILIGCNSSGTTKLPLLVCGPYPSRITSEDHVYCHNEDSLIDDDLFKNWLTSVNDRMSRCDQQILLFLQRNRAHALRDFPLSNVKLVYMPEDFPPHLRPLRRDVFHYVKMIFRRRYAERLGQCAVEWNLRDILESLVDAWEKIPREIIICRFQRTYFRTDDYFLQIDCNCWKDLKTGIAFKRFVTFDDDLSSKKESSVKNSDYCDYNLRPSCSGNVQINEDDLSFTSESEEEVEETRKDKSQLKGDSTEGDSDQTRSRKRPYNETQYSSEEERGDRQELGDRMIKNIFASEDPCVGCSRSISKEQFERQTLQRHRPMTNDATKSLPTVIDKALTLTSSTTADHAKELINSIYASKQKTKRDVDCQTEFGTLNGEEMESCSNKLLKIDTENRTLPDQSSNGLSSNQQENSKFPRKERQKSQSSGCGDESNSSESSEKKLKIDYSWSKQFETTFVFGPSDDPEHGNCSSQHQHDESVADSRILTMTPSISPKE